MALDNKDPAEKVVVTFDFSALATTVSTPVVSAESAGGTNDPTPSAILSGSPNVSGAQVLQLVVGGVPGADYKLKCQVDDGAERFVVADTLQVRSA